MSTETVLAPSKWRIIAQVLFGAAAGAAIIVIGQVQGNPYMLPAGLVLIGTCWIPSFIIAGKATVNANEATLTIRGKTHRIPLQDLDVVVMSYAAAPREGPSKSKPGGLAFRHGKETIGMPLLLHSADGVDSFCSSLQMMGISLETEVTPPA